MRSLTATKQLDFAVGSVLASMGAPRRQLAGLIGQQLRSRLPPRRSTP